MQGSSIDIRSTRLRSQLYPSNSQLDATDERHAPAQLAPGLGRRLLRHRHFGISRSWNSLRPRRRQNSVLHLAHHPGSFILLALKYIEITWRNPEGGGVVTITTKAFGPMWGCLGGMLITVQLLSYRGHLRGFWFSLRRQCFPFSSTRTSCPLACPGLLASGHS